MPDVITFIGPLGDGIVVQSAHALCFGMKAQHGAVHDSPTQQVGHLGHRITQSVPLDERITRRPRPIVTRRMT